MMNNNNITDLNNTTEIEILNWHQYIVGRTEIDGHFTLDGAYFELTQNNSDKKLLEDIRDTLKCGKYI